MTEAWKQGALFEHHAADSSERVRNTQTQATYQVCWRCRSRLTDQEVQMYSDDGWKHCSRCRVQWGPKEDGR